MKFYVLTLEFFLGVIYRHELKHSPLGVPRNGAPKI